MLVSSEGFLLHVKLLTLPVDRHLIGQWLVDQLPPELGPADKDQKVCENLPSPTTVLHKDGRIPTSLRICGQLQVWEWLAWIAVILEAVVLLVSVAIATKIRIAIAMIQASRPSPSHPYWHAQRPSADSRGRSADGRESEPGSTS